MSYYSAQARNAANLPHRVSFASFAEGKPIEGKLSDFKTDATRHLWRDEEPENIKKFTQNRADWNKKGVHCRDIPEQINEDVYLKLDEAVKVIGGSVCTIRVWIKEKKIADVKLIPRNGGFTYLVNMKELTAFARSKRTYKESAKVGSWRQRNKEKSREYALKYYHEKKKFKEFKTINEEAA